MNESHDVHEDLLYPGCYDGHIYGQIVDECVGYNGIWWVYFMQVRAPACQLKKISPGRFCHMFLPRRGIPRFGRSAEKKSLFPLAIILHRPLIPRGKVKKKLHVLKSTGCFSGQWSKQNVDDLTIKIWHIFPWNDGCLCLKIEYQILKDCGSAQTAATLFHL